MQKAISNLAIQDVFLRETSAHIADDYDPTATSSLPLLVQHRQGLAQIWNGEVEVEEGKVRLIRFCIETGVRFIEGSPPVDLESRVTAEITAVFVAEYQVIDANVAMDDELEAFGRKNAVFHVWPYWREYIQSTAVRFRLPPVALPMFQIRNDNVHRQTENSEPRSKDHAKTAHTSAAVRKTSEKVSKKKATKRRSAT